MLLCRRVAAIVPSQRVLSLHARMWRAAILFAALCVCLALHTPHFAQASTTNKFSAARDTSVAPRMYTDTAVVSTTAESPRSDASMEDMLREIRALRHAHDALETLVTVQHNNSVAQQRTIVSLEDTQVVLQAEVDALRADVYALQAVGAARDSEAPSSSWSAHSGPTRRSLLSARHAAYNQSVVHTCSLNDSTRGYIKLVSDDSSTGLLFNCDTAIQFNDGVLFVDQVAFTGGGNVSTAGSLDAGGVTLADGAVNGVSFAGDGDISTNGTLTAGGVVFSEGLVAGIDLSIFKRQFQEVSGPRWTLMNNSVICYLSDVTDTPTMLIILNACFKDAVTDPTNMYGLTYALLDGTMLPPGLTLTADGTVTGGFDQEVIDAIAPNVPAVYEFNLRVTSRAGIDSVEDRTLTLHLWDEVRIDGPVGGTRFAYNPVGVSYDGTSVLIGAYYTDTYAGAVHAYEWDEVSGGFSAPAEVGNVTALGSGFYGYRTSLSDDGLTALVTMPHSSNDANITESGEAVFFKRASTSDAFEPVTQVRSDSPAEGNEFGRAALLSANGSMAVLSERFYDAGGFVDGGVVFVFRWNGTAYVRTEKLLPASGSTNMWYGNVIAMTPAGDFLALTRGTAYTVYVFQYNGVQLEMVSELNPPGCTGGDFIGGMSFDASGAILAVGRHVCVNSHGAVYLYANLEGAGFALIQVVTATDSALDDYFGSSVALSRDATTLVVSAPRHNSFLGAVYVFSWDASSDTFQQTRKVERKNPTVNEKFGLSVELSGDGTTVFASSWVRDFVSVFKV